MSYKNATLNLAAIIGQADKVVVPGVPQNKRIGAVSVTRLPAGASMRLHLGEQEGIWIDGVLTLFAGEGDEDTMRGLYFSNDIAQPGVTAEITVSFAGPVTQG